MRNLIIVAVAAALSACAVGPDYVQPDLPDVERFANLHPAVYSDQESLAEFWKQFDDPTLNQLVEDALRSNHDLRIALARFAEARAILGQTTLDLAPTITASGGYVEQRTSRAEPSAAFGRNQEFYDAGFDAFWELDFFGRVRRSIQAGYADAESAEASLRDAQVIVIAEVARTYFELRGQQSQLDVARRNVANQRETFDLTTIRLQAGRGTELDTSRAQAQLSTTLASIGPLEAAVARSQHRLAVLTGRTPESLQELLAPTRELPPLPQIAAVGSPEAMLRRRPDIRVAERDLAAATARIGVAVADLFPRVSFTGSVGSVATSASGLGDSGNDTYTLAPGLTWAALDLGRVRARIAGARARTEASLA
ncbi:MAG TPA: efflux transporter outer membrane subunit, partial [Steroidobacteraceae bacterium]